MPPGGQSVGLGFEDAVVISRLLSSSPESMSLEGIFKHFVTIRKPRVESHYKQMAERWKGIEDFSYWVQRLREWFVWLYLAYFASFQDENFSYDPTKVDLWADESPKI